MLKLSVATKMRAADNAAVTPAVGERVRLLRLKKGLTQAQLAADADVTSNTIRGLERGTLQTRWPKFTRIAHALGTTPEALMRGDDPVATDNPLLNDLNDEDLRIAQAFHHARTPTRLSVERLLNLTDDPILRIAERLQNLPDKLRASLEGVLSAAEKSVSDERRKGTPTTNHDKKKA